MASMSLYEALCYADHASPMPASASCALKVLRRALADALAMTEATLIEVSSDYVREEDEVSWDARHAKPLDLDPETQKDFEEVIRAFEALNVPSADLPELGISNDVDEAIHASDTYQTAT